MTHTKNISDFNILSQKNTRLLSFCNQNNIFTFKSKQNKTFYIKTNNGNSEEPHVRPYLFPYMWSVKHTHGVSGCINRMVESTTTATEKNNNDSNNDNNNNRNMNNNHNCIHNTCYKRYTKHISHVSTCVQSFFKPIYNIGLGIKKHACAPLRTCLFVSTMVFTSVSCTNRLYIYRVEFSDGTVEYFNMPPERALESTETVKATTKIKADEIEKYENQ